MRWLPQVAVAPLLAVQLTSQGAASTAKIVMTNSTMARRRRVVVQCVAVVFVRFL